MTLLIYIIKTVFISAILLGYYWLFLRNRSFHGFNRFFLLAIPVFSLVVPALHLSIPALWSQAGGDSPIHLLGVGRGSLEEAVTIYGSQGTGRFFTWEYISVLISLLISTYFSVGLYKSIRFLLILKKQSPSLPLPEATLYFVSEKGTPFSFFKSIFWGKEMELDNPDGKQILRHEIFHVKQQHSLDILLLEIFSIGMWFNPFLHFIRREIKAIHEYAADAYAAAGSDEYAYAKLLLLKVSGTNHSLTNPFFKNQIKRRITMITNPNKNNKNLLGRVMFLPLAAILICLFSFKIQNHFSLLKSKSIRVVIDAGHGGSFTGAQSNGMLEKNINLVIAKKIKSLSGEYNVEVIMSRETDMTPGSNELRESLEWIAALPKNKNADLFISIHTNTSDHAQPGILQTSKSGFQIYIPRNTSAVYEGSVKFGSIMTEAIKSDYLIEPELKQTPGDGGNILILKKATVPAILIECGYMDNPSDQKYLQDEKNQEKIARDILEGIRKYGNESTVYKMNALSNESGPNTKNPRFQTVNYSHLNENLKDSAAPLRKVEVEASYPGGKAAWGNFLFKNLNYPEEADKKKIQGDVVVEFVVNEDGSLSNIHALSGPQSLRKESVRVISASGKWIPAVDQGKKVASYHKQPINYRLQS